MQFSSLGSGSKGNATLIRNGDCLLLVDCGFTLKETKKRLADLGVRPEQLSALIVSHEHKDHITGVGALSRRYQLPVYMTQGTWRSRNIGEVSRLHLIRNYSPFEIEGLTIFPVAVPHDAAEPAQYIISNGVYKLGILTDVGIITPHVASHFADCDALILEANHDSGMLASGPYPYSLKQRVAGAWGHLNNQQAASFLSQAVCRHKLQCLVLAHMSEQNNSLECVKRTFCDVLDDVERVIYAEQDTGFEWVTLTQQEEVTSQAI